MVDGRNFRQAIWAFRTGNYNILKEGGNSPIYLKNKAAVDSAAAAKAANNTSGWGASANDPDGGMGGDNDTINLPDIAIPKTSGKVTPVTSTPAIKPVATTTPKAAATPTTSAKPVDDSDDDAGAAAENPDKFQFGSAKGSSKVSAQELQNWRDSTGNSTGTLGQYMNARDGKTFVAGGANDPSVISKNTSDNTPLPPPRPTDLPITDPAKPVAQSSIPPSLAKATSTAPTTDTSTIEAESGGKTKKKAKTMKESIVSNYAAFITNSMKSSNLFESAKRCKECGQSPCICENKKTPEKKLMKTMQEGAVATQMHVHDTKSKNFAVDHISGNKKEAEPMPKLTKLAPAVRMLEKDKKHVPSNSKTPAEPMPKLTTLDPMTKKLAGVREELENYLSNLDEDVLNELSNNTLGSYVVNARKQISQNFKNPNFDVSKRVNGTNKAKNKMTDDYNIPGGGKVTSTNKKVNEENENLFSEEELAHIAAMLEEEGEEAPVKRGRGRPKGSKSAASIHGDSQDEEGNSYGTKNLQAQIRTSRNFYKNGTEHKTLIHPETGKSHDVPLHHITKFSDDLADAEKPQQKLDIESAFKKKHMS